MSPQDDGIALTYESEQGVEKTLHAGFCLDASGFGRVLPRFLNLDRPSDFPVRRSLFTHVKDHITDDKFDRHKILVTVHPVHHDVWFWLIPFSNGTSSLGVVAEPAFLDKIEGDDQAVLQTLIAEVPNLSKVLAEAEYPMAIRSIGGYSSSVSGLYGKNFALLGNAGEFLDPVFSSGVTIALKSASLAAGLLARQLSGERVDWRADFADPLGRGVETFRHFVTAWYSGALQDIFFASYRDPKIQRMICAILAGYAWDESNPYVAQPKRRLATLAELCRGVSA